MNYLKNQGNHLDNHKYVRNFVHKNVPIMLIASVSDFRKDIKSYLDKVIQNLETLIINRGKDTGVVIMSLSEYNSLMATVHELKSKKNRQRLDSAIDKLNSGGGFEKELIQD